MTEQTSRPMMSFGQSIKTCFRKYVDFSGRATRAEYWWFVLLILLVQFSLFAIVCVTTDGCTILFSGELHALWLFAILLPLIPATSRRLHDVGFSGWRQLIFVPGIIVLVTAFNMVNRAIGGSDPLVSGFKGILYSFNLIPITTVTSIFTAMGVAMIGGWIIEVPIRWCLEPSQTEPNKYGDPPLVINH